LSELERLSGYPTSSNRASSFHLHWLPRVELNEVAVTISVAAAPQVGELYFWALQASFSGDGGISGGAHLGLQWNRHHPGATAINWGGYDSAGATLEGTESALPSATGNPHTRDFPWSPGAEYRLRIRPDRAGWWVGEVVDLAEGATTIIRSLRSAGDRLVTPMVWSEVFARCDDPPAAVVWSHATGVTVADEAWTPESFSTFYQREADGGCSNTDSRSLPHGVGQFSGVTRTNPTGTILPLSAG
jgi:hypothetical protein